MVISLSLGHHAYCVVGDAEETISELLETFTSLGIAVAGNPDFRVERQDVFGIDEARALREAAERRAVTQGKKIFVVASSAFTKEAQNALLKTFEEPFPGTHFFIITPAEELLLPTLRSRLHIISVVRRREDEEARKSATSFLAESLRERLGRVKQMLHELEEGTGSREAVFEFLDALERELAEKGSRVYPEALSSLLTIKRYSHDRSPSLKLLLEQLALML